MVTTKTLTIDFNRLFESDKWLINYFFSESLEKKIFDFPMVKLASLLTERSETIEPQKYKDSDFIYIGLENIESNTGFIVGKLNRTGNEVKSRSKVFYSGDLIYGKLRPSLNKAYVVSEQIPKGICSNEFLVFKVNTERIRPYFLRFLLTSNYVLEQVKSFTGGSALPRIHIADFLNIEVPLPQIEEIILLEERIHKSYIKLSHIKKVLENTSRFYNSEFDKIFTLGELPTFDLDNIC